MTAYASQLALLFASSGQLLHPTLRTSVVFVMAYGAFMPHVFSGLPDNSLALICKAASCHEKANPIPYIINFLL